MDSRAVFEAQSYFPFDQSGARLSSHRTGFFFCILIIFISFQKIHEMFELQHYYRHIRRVDKFMTVMNKVNITVISQACFFLLFVFWS